ncbi:MAG TPA: phospholipase D-like domain-containing protein [Polyangiaceae bacterium]|jgi:cardiolipin synthase|nr:phospholipase D-like domain-containing protein [Polyangiaceae bacterium]
MTYLLSHAAVLVTILAWVVMLARISGSQRTPQSTFAWLLAFALVPPLAIPLYFALGSRKFPARAKGRQLAVPPPRTGHSFELLGTGESAFSRLLALIQGAERSIDLTMFILGDDATGHAVIGALADRARKGVAVRVILDAVGCVRTHRAAARALREAGADLRIFMPIRHSPIRGRTNLRSHRKVVIVDGDTIFAGGMNLAGEYMGAPLPEPREPEPREPAGRVDDRSRQPAPRWRDVVAIVQGPAAADATALFESDWVFCGGSPRPRKADAAAIGPRGEERVQFVPIGPDMTTDTMYDILLCGIFQARERVAIVTPYYVPDDALQHALVLAARRGVKVELLVPAWSNHRVADLARRGFVRELKANGILLHYYARGMVHAKAMLIDGEFAYVGSPNFDMRSLFLNYEDALCVTSSAAVAQVRGFIDGLIAECVTEPPVFPEHRVIEQLALLVAPEL